MSHHWWLPCLVLLYVTLLGFGTCNSLFKALRNKQTHLLEPLRWQIAGYILVAFAYEIALVCDFTWRLSEVIMLIIFVMLFVPGMFALLYGERRERNSKTAAASSNDIG